MKGTIFSRINELKALIKEHLLANQDLLKLIVYTDDNPLELPDIDDTQSLLNEYIFLNPVVWDGTIEETKTFLLTSIRISSISNDYANVYLYFYIISHNKLYELQNGDTRVVSICDELMKSFDSSYGNWIGKCVFKSTQEITTRKDYYSMEMQFMFTDFKK